MKYWSFIITFLLELSAPIAIGYAILTQVLSLIMLAVLNRQISNFGNWISSIGF